MGELVRRLTSRQRLAAVTLALIAAAFFVLDLSGSSLSQAHSGGRGVLGALYRGTDSVLGPVRRYTTALPGAAHDSARITTLENENAQLKSQLASSTDSAADSAQLAKLQLIAGGSGHPVVPARVIAFGPGQGFDWTATIDAGTTSHIAVDQTVTSAAGLVGRVLRADASTAVVLLAADPGSGVGVRDVRSGELLLATGAGTDGFSLSPLNPTADIKIGDQLETGPAGSSTFVAGLPVATITAVHANSAASVTATASAAVKPTTVDLVGVIVSGDSSEAATAPRAPLTGTSR
jgi:rod shape-determining protein MreC